MACEQVQFSKKTHGDGAGIVRKLDANRKRIPATCASSGQSKRFLAALVLACPAEDVNQFVPAPCAGEKVQLSGTLQLHFETINGVAHPKLMAARLEATGTGQSTHRTYEAISTPIDSDVNNVRKVLGETHGHWTLKFKVVANSNPPGQVDVCPGCVFQFTLKYSVHYSALAKVLEIFGIQEPLCP
ncbi:MAG: hypothetical protein Udaeo2_32330 [Candidatus Udaeobacter sp.]|jgi:hypothetical protein|nr:MAG: hypothetical protein Udaeo2_32330 [Candidatus Udaeobacter sp.]